MCKLSKMCPSLFYCFKVYYFSSFEVSSLYHQKMINDSFVFFLLLKIIQHKVSLKKNETTEMLSIHSNKREINLKSLFFFFVFNSFLTRYRSIMLDLLFLRINGESKYLIHWRRLRRDGFYNKM
jgi:hypothetical protein